MSTAAAPTEIGPSGAAKTASGPSVFSAKPLGGFVVQSANPSAIATTTTTLATRIPRRFSHFFMAASCRDACTLGSLFEERLRDPDELEGRREVHRVGAPGDDAELS